jgi:hypothetical protein
LITSRDKIYAPSEADQTLIDDVEGKYDRWKQDRRPHEIQWFLNAAHLCGQQNVEYDRVGQQISVPDAPSHRQRLVANRIWPKYKARLAKFLKGRPIPLVIPASTDRQDKLNARATQKVLDYLWRKLTLEVRYKQALEWSAVCGKGFWWYHWNPKKMGRVRVDGPLGPKVQTAELGDPEVEVGSAFEVLVPDMGVARIADQHEIMRIKVREVEEVKSRYPKVAEFIRADTAKEDVFQYERQIASLTPKGSYNAGVISKKDADPSHVVVKELFVRPCGKYPEGAHIVVANKVLLKQGPLPYNFGDCENPFPVTEFVDVQMAGRFFPTTVVEQLIGLQKERNLIRSKVAEQLRMGAHPKVLAAQQHQLPEDAWNSEAGEIVTYVALPGIPPPTPRVPPHKPSDSWRSLDRIDQDFDAITQIYPSSEGQAGGAESGFQTNLLQEAADTAHIPDIRSYELAIEEAAFKLRRLMAQGYTEPRLITIMGRNYQPEVLEFSNSMIDEHAEVVVQIGSGLPQLKASKIQSVMELWDRGMLGNPADPENQRKALSALDLGELEGMQETSRRDEDLAKLENQTISDGGELPPPDFYHNHDIHYEVHADQLKSVEAQGWDPALKQALVTHVIQHMEHINPVAAWNLAVKLGLADPATGQGIVAMPQMGPPGAQAVPGVPPPGPAAPAPPGGSAPEPPPPPTL